MCKPQDSPYGSALIDAHFHAPCCLPQAFLDFAGDHLPQEIFLDLPTLTGEELHDVTMAKKSTSGGLDGWARNEVKALSLSLHLGLSDSP